jgi:transposase
VDGMTAPMVLDGPMNRVAFPAYIEQVLVPTLHRGETVIMDNLPAHKGGGSAPGDRGGRSNATLPAARLA